MTSGTQRANSRIRLLVVAFTCVFAVGLGRAAWIQIVDGAGYEAMASRQHRETIEIPAGRGTIYDRTGEPLAIGEQATSVYADPRNVIAPKKAAVKVAQATRARPRRAVSEPRRPHQAVRVHRPEGGSRQGAAPSRSSASPASASSPRSAAPTPRGVSPHSCSGSQAPTTAGSTGSSARSTARSQGRRGTRSSCAIPRDRPSTS